MSLKIKIDVEAIAKQFKEFSIEVKQDLEKAVAGLAAITHAKVAEMAATELKTSRKSLMDNLGFEEVSKGIWVVSIDENAMWIEEGVEPEFDMKPGLLKNATKVSKDGHKYRVIPFDYGSKGPTQLTPNAQTIVNTIRSGLKKANVSFKTIERNGDGSPKLGKLHTFNFESAIPGKGNTPQLKGVSIYQTLTKTGNVRRDILTFRTVTDGPGSEGKWISPGQPGKKFLDRAADWAINEWESKILPEVTKKWGE